MARHSIVDGCPSALRECSASQGRLRLIAAGPGVVIVNSKLCRLAVRVDAVESTLQSPRDRPQRVAPLELASREPVSVLQGGRL